MASYLEQAAQKYGLVDANRVSIPVDHVLQPDDKEQQANHKEYLEVTGVYAWAVRNCYPNHNFALNTIQHVMHAPTVQHEKYLRRAFIKLYQGRHAGLILHGPRSKFWSTPPSENFAATTANKAPSAMSLANAKQRMQLLTSLVKMPVEQNPLLLLQGMGTYDANYGGNGFDEKPQLSANFYLCGSAQSWKSCKAKIHCTSTAEAELCARAFAQAHPTRSRLISAALRKTAPRDLRHAHAPRRLPLTAAMLYRYGEWGSYESSHSTAIFTTRLYLGFSSR